MDSTSCLLDRRALKLRGLNLYSVSLQQTAVLLPVLRHHLIQWQQIPWTTQPDVQYHTTLSVLILTCHWRPVPMHSWSPHSCPSRFSLCDQTTLAIPYSVGTQHKHHTIVGSLQEPLKSGHLDHATKWHCANSIWIHIQWIVPHIWVSPLSWGLWYSLCQGNLWLWMSVVCSRVRVHRWRETSEDSPSTQCPLFELKCLTDKGDVYTYTCMHFYLVCGHTVF